MSAEATGLVWRHSPYKGAELLIHLAMADVANEQNDYLLFMRHENIAKKARVSRRTVTTVIQKMIADGWLTLVAEASGQKPAYYQLGLLSSTQSTTSGTQSVQSGTQSATTPLLTITKRTYTIGKYSDEEESIWKLYPKRTGSNPKSEAINHYRKWIAAGVCHDTLMAATKNYAQERDGQDAIYTMQAARFFGPFGPWRDYEPPSGAIDIATAPTFALFPDFLIDIWNSWESTNSWVDKNGVVWYDAPSTWGIPRPPER